MNKKSLRPWWLRKRLLLPLVLVVTLLASVVVAVLTSDESTIVVYNETGEALPPLMVQACNQAKTFTGLEDQDSVRFILKPKGAGSPIHLELASDPAWTWDGEFVQPHGGYRVSIRLLTGKQVEAYTDISWWRKTFMSK